MTLVDPVQTGIEAPIESTHIGIPIRNVWYMLMYAWGTYRHSPLWQRVSVDQCATLDALLASILLHLVQQRIRIGLGRDYQPMRESMSRIRGKVLFKYSINERAADTGRLTCEYQYYDINALSNQIIKSTMRYLLTQGEFGTSSSHTRALKHKLTRLIYIFDQVDDIRLTPATIRRALETRYDRDYRIMLTLCELVLRRSIPSEEDGMIFTNTLERERLTMHAVFEKFVTEFYRHHLVDWDVSPQKQLSWFNTNEVESLPVMKPDIVLTSKQAEHPRMLVVDTKYTAKRLKQNQWGKYLYDSSHLYQMYAYLRTQDAQDVNYRDASGMLLYPALGDESTELIQLPSHSIAVTTVSLAAPWQYIEARLLDLLAEI